MAGIVPITIFFDRNDLDKELLESRRKRDWRKTCIVDVRPFRINERRMLKPVEVRERQGNLA
jgi:hypothetical protein